MIPKIFPRNLTARAAAQLVGNPVTSRLESAVGNCFPGLEFDHRNLDRRFFVGLIFEFTDAGVQLLGVDLKDPDLTNEVQLQRALTGAPGNKLRNGSWFLQSVAQGAKTIAMSQDGANLELMVAWRLVHSLEPGRVTIELKNRAEQPGERIAADTVTLTGRPRCPFRLEEAMAADGFDAGLAPTAGQVLTPLFPQSHYSSIRSCGLLPEMR